MSAFDQIDSARSATGFGAMDAPADNTRAVGRPFTTEEEKKREQTRSMLNLIPTATGFATGGLGMLLGPEVAAATGPLGAAAGDAMKNRIGFNMGLNYAPQLGPQILSSAIQAGLFSAPEFLASKLTSLPRSIMGASLSPSRALEERFPYTDIPQAVLDEASINKSLKGEAVRFGKLRASSASDKASLLSDVGPRPSGPPFPVPVSSGNSMSVTSPIASMPRSASPIGDVASGFSKDAAAKSAIYDYASKRGVDPKTLAKVVSSDSPSISELARLHQQGVTTQDYLWLKTVAESQAQAAKPIGTPASPAVSIQTPVYRVVRPRVVGKTYKLSDVLGTRTPEIRGELNKINWSADPGDKGEVRSIIDQFISAHLGDVSPATMDEIKQIAGTTAAKEISDAGKVGSTGAIAKASNWTHANRIIQKTIRKRLGEDIPGYTGMDNLTQARMAAEEAVKSAHYAGGAPVIGNPKATIPSLLSSGARGTGYNAAVAARLLQDPSVAFMLRHIPKLPLGWATAGITSPDPIDTTAVK